MGRIKKERNVVRTSGVIERGDVELGVLPFLSHKGGAFSADLFSDPCRGTVFQVFHFRLQRIRPEDNPAIGHIRVRNIYNIRKM